MVEEGVKDELISEQQETLKFIIQYLFDALNDDDGGVRWTAAKGIGRIALRLPEDFADHIID